MAKGKKSKVAKTKKRATKKPAKKPVKKVEKRKAARKLSREKEIEKLEKEILDPIKEKNKLMLTPSSPITTKQVVQMFQRTPAEHVHKRPAKGGGEWDYVTGVYVRKVLNFVFGFLWSFSILDKGREGNMVWVHGRLTINDPKNPSQVIITKEQFGRADIKFKKNSKEMLDYGNDLKAAATDALKKCASELGIASDVYGKAEFKTSAGIDIDAEKAMTDKRTKTIEAEEVEYECNGCAEPITEAEATYSKNLYKKPLCRVCQKEQQK